MSKTAKWTAYALIAATAALIGWELYTLTTGAKDDTISQVMYKYARQWPILPFALGILFGHWFWPLKPKTKDG